MKLFFRETGKGTPLVILHGLYGSSDNWMTVARHLGQRYHVYLPDQRNHGLSPHSPRHDYPAMVADLEAFADDRDLGPFVLMGHSMGGKTAMFYALRHPERIKALISVDISPRAYHITGDNGTSFSMHKKMMEALLQLDLTTMHSRREVMKALEKDIPPERIRQFLLKNLTRDDKKRFRWKINLPVLRESLENILYGVDSDPGTGNISPASFPVLFIRGATSGYIRDEDIPLIRRLFPTAEIITIPDAGHWLHAEQPEKFLDTIRVFLQRSGIT